MRRTSGVFSPGYNYQRMSIRVDGNGNGNGNRNGEMTLGFELAAFETFAHPKAVIDDAGRWSRYVGLIANDADAARSYIDEHELDFDFDAGHRDKWLALREIRERTNTARHVFVGRSGDGRRAAERTGWEFLFVEEAAEKAGWTISERSNRRSGIVARLRNWLRRNSR